MKDESKTKKQLIDELAQMRRRLAESEAMQKRATANPEAQAEPEERWHSLAEMAPDHIVTIDMKGIITCCNATAAKATGYSRPGIIGKHFSELPFLSARDMPTYLRLFGSLVRGATPEAFEAAWHDKDGKPHWSEVRVSLIKQKGHTQGFQAIARDFSEHKQTEQALRESEEKYRNLVERANDGIAIIQDRRVCFANQRLAEMWGGTVDEVLDTPLTDYVHPDALPEVLDRHKRRMAGEHVTPTYDTILRQRNGDKVYAQVNAGLINYNGEPADLVLVRDIGERRRAEDELRESHDRLQRILDQSINALAAAVEARDVYTAGHQRRVANLACAIAEEMRLSEDQIRGLRMAGLVHDLGKIFVPGEILTKPGRLTDDELATVRNHAQAGYDILKTVDFPWPVAEIVLQHHERSDGSGYPRGLSAQEILLEARIMAVADFVEAMASDRPYRPGHDLDELLEELARDRDTLYDPEVADACLRLFTEEGFELKP